MLRTHGIAESCLVFLLFSIAAPSQGEAAGKSWFDRLAELGLRVGEPVESVQQFSFNKWDYLDPKHIVVYGEADRPFLVTLDTRCDGMRGNEVWVRNRQPGVLQRRDEVEVRHEGRTADRCDVENLEQLLLEAPD